MKKQKVGAVIKELREAKGLTQEAVAERANITRGYLAMLETGRKGNPSLAVLQRLAKVLKVPVVRLLGESIPHTPRRRGRKDGVR